MLPLSRPTVPVLICVSWLAANCYLIITLLQMFYFLISILTIVVIEVNLTPLCSCTCPHMMALHIYEELHKCDFVTIMVYGAQ